MKNSSAKKVLNKIKKDRRGKFQNYAETNKKDIARLLEQHNSTSAADLQADIDMFLAKALNKEECYLLFPAGFDPGLLSLLLNNLSLWLGNMKQVLRNLPSHTDAEGAGGVTGLEEIEIKGMDEK
jgi:hypothetical protein